MTWRVLPCLAVACFAALAASQTKEESVQKALDDYIAANKVVGASVSIITADGAVFATGSGFQDRENKVAATGETVYRLGSISKPITAVAALQLVEQNRLSLFSNVTMSAPEWPDKGVNLTLRHLLTHTGGVRHYTPTKRDMFFEPYTVARSLDVFKDDDLLFKPGERVSYSTHAFSLVARMVEVASGKGFAAYLYDQVSLPAGATTLSIEDRSIPKDARTQLYGLIANGSQPSRELFIENITWKSGGGGMESSAPDLARFGHALVTGKLLSAQLTDFMLQRQTVDGLDTGRTLGWALDPAGNPEHGGAQQGCRTFMKIDRETKTVYVVMTNTGGSHPIGQLLASVIDAWKGPGYAPTPPSVLGEDEGPM
jgi:CubicO group peptidase (beta-lactamase class C family)